MLSLPSSSNIRSTEDFKKQEHHSTDEVTTLLWELELLDTAKVWLN